MGKQFLERKDLMVRHVTAVIDNDIDQWSGRFEVAPECLIALITDADLDLIRFISLAGWLDVDAVDDRLRTEIVCPHGQTAAAVYPDLKDMNWPVSKWSKVAMIDVEIMFPFPYAGASSVSVEIVTERDLMAQRIGLTVGFVIADSRPISPCRGLRLTSRPRGEITELTNAPMRMAFPPKRYQARLYPKRICCSRDVDYVRSQSIASSCPVFPRLICKSS